MAKGVNKVILVGNLGADPEVRYTADSTAVASFSLATSEKWKGKDGQEQERTEWHNIVFYGRLGEVCGEYLKKGSQIYVEGKLRTRKWQDKEGKDRYTTEIIGHEMQMLGTRSNNEGGGQPQGQRQGGQQRRQQDQPGGQQHKPTAAAGNFDDFDDDIPF